MAEPKVDVEVHLKEMKECGGALQDASAAFVKGTEGIFGAAGGAGAGGMAANVKSAAWGRRSDVLKQTKAVDQVADNAWSELDGFTQALGKNAADLGNFTTMMAGGIQAYGDMAITAHDVYVKTDQDHENKLGAVDLPDKKDAALAGDIHEQKVAGSNQSGVAAQPPAPAA